MALKGKLKRFHRFIQTKRAGELVTVDEVLDNTTWSRSTFDTYLNKNNLRLFLARGQQGDFRVLQDGQAVLEDAVAEAFTQVRETGLVLVKGTNLKGAGGNYQLIERLGNGAVAHVWKALNVDSSDFVAAKVMNPREDLLEPSTLENVAKRFSREARNGQKLNHPHLVKYQDYGELSGHPFLIMSLADCSVGQLLKERSLSFREALKVMQHCIDGLAYLHSEECIHRDIKPDNILKIGNRFLLGDFGIVRWPEWNPSFVSAGTITRNSVQLGSWYYMASEQRAAPHKAEKASDVYSLGISWYEMLTRQKPDPAAAAAGIISPVPDNEAATNLIRRMLAFDPAQRPTVSELKQKLSKMDTLL